MKVSMEDSAPAFATIYNSIHRFQNGEKGFEEHDRAGRAVTQSRPENNERFKKVLKNDKRLSVRKVADIVGMPDRTVHRVMTEHLEMRNFQGS